MKKHVIRKSGMIKRLLSSLVVLALCLAMLPSIAAAHGDMGKPGFFTTIAFGEYHSAAIAANGDLYVWGLNEYGQFGNGQRGLDERSNIPIKVPSLSNVVSVTVGERFTAAVTSNGDLYTWGDNGSGQLGHGDQERRTNPTKVAALSNVVCVSASRTSANGVAAVTSNGDLYTWGSQSAMLGIERGVHVSVPTPKKVESVSDVAVVVMGTESHALITKNGDLYTWGVNVSGCLGHGVFGSDGIKVSPTKVAALSNVVSVSMAQGHSAAVTANGDLYTWGDNNDGQLGHGHTDRLNTPTKVSALSNVSAVSLGRSHTMAITKNGDLYSCGNNSDGRLGLGNTDNGPKTPTKVSALSNVTAANAAISTSAALTGDGKLYSWGATSISLGIGETEGIYVVAPQLVMSGVMIPKSNASMAVTPPTPPRDSNSDVMVRVYSSHPDFSRGGTVVFDQPPVIQNGRTLVPVRAVFEALLVDVEWDNATQTVTASKGSLVVKLTIGSNIMTRNNAPITLDVPAQVINGRTLIPLRAAAEAFQAEVIWDAATQTAHIYESLYGGPRHDD